MKKQRFIKFAVGTIHGKSLFFFLITSTYLLFHHPNKVDSDGDVLFNTDLIKVEVSISNAQAIFDRALEVLGGDMPKPHKDCGFCSWVGQCKLF